ncbi:MAG: CopD family protein [Gammaproteobacteria bacterium]|nr:CopD family protein [Gammaproteobacteria bacterium]
MLWIKAFHIISMVTWFAGLFYLPRLYVYHSITQDQPGIDRFKLMERKLFWGITTPGGLMTWIFGLWLLGYYPADALRTMPWLHIKLVLVILLTGYHVWCGKLLLNFKHDRNQHSEVWYRWFNEVPVFFLIAIILLVELQPTW